MMVAEQEADRAMAELLGDNDDAVANRPTRRKAKKAKPKAPNTLPQAASSDAASGSAKGRIFPKQADGLDICPADTCDVDKDAELHHGAVWYRLVAQMLMM